MLSKNSKIFLAGHRGMVGSAILRKLKLEKYKNLILIEKKKLDLLDQKKVYDFLKKKKTTSSYNCSCQSRRNSCEL